MNEAVAARLWPVRAVYHPVCRALLSKFNSQFVRFWTLQESLERVIPRRNLQEEVQWMGFALTDRSDREDQSVEWCQ